jgi:hypothetical protein
MNHRNRPGLKTALITLTTLIMLKKNTDNTTGEFNAVEEMIVVPRNLQQRAGKFDCGDCNAVFGSNTGLYRHRQSKHEGIICI